MQIIFKKCERYVTNMWIAQWEGKTVYLAKNPFCPGSCAIGFGNVPGVEISLDEVPEMLGVDEIILE